MVKKSILLKTLARVIHASYAGPLILLATACGDSDTGTVENVQETTEQLVAPAELTTALQQVEEIVEQEVAAEQARSAAKYPCDLFNEGELDELLGSPVMAGDYTFEHHNENTGSWRADSCSWSGEVDGGTTLTMWVSGPPHFDSGKIECHGMTTAENADPDLGGMSKWEYQKSWGWGTLRGCAAEKLFEIEVMYGASEDSVRAIARAVAQKILGN